MPHPARYHVIASTLFLLTALSCAAPQPKPPATAAEVVHATVRLRPGARPPSDAILHVTVRSAAGFVYGHHGAPVREWPVHVSIPIREWPISKGFPITLWANARAESAGRDVLVTESDLEVDQDDVRAAKPYELTLHPTIE